MFRVANIVRYNNPGASAHGNIGRVERVETYNLIVRWVKSGKTVRYRHDTWELVEDLINSEAIDLAHIEEIEKLIDRLVFLSGEAWDDKFSVLKKVITEFMSEDVGECSERNLRDLAREYCGGP